MNCDFLAEFDVIGAIGEGGLANVIKVRAKNTGQVFAFKKLIQTDSPNLDALQKEYQFLQTHPHPNIVQVNNYIDCPTDTGILMEYLAGVSLQKKCGSLENHVLISTITSILETAQFVCHCGYIYNDYKSQNFVYSADGQLKLIDFNLIQKQNHEIKQQCGTLEYLAPEILTGGDASITSDIYALGVTFYELIAGRPPFVSTSQDSLLKLITESAPPPLSQCDGKINSAILAMLSKNPSDRPANPYAAAELFGLHKEINLLLKERASFYLHAGLAHLSGNSGFGVTEDSINNLVDQYLKRHSLNANHINQLALFSGGDSQAIYEYLYHLIITDIIKYNENGWQAIRQFNDSDIPPAIRDRYLADYSQLPQTSQTILNWLAIFDEPQASSVLIALGGVPPAQFHDDLSQLYGRNRLANLGEAIAFLNRGQARSIYDNIPLSQRQKMHGQAADYLNQRSPLDIDQIALHYGLSDNLTLSLKFNHQAAQLWFEKFDNSIAKKFIDKALCAVERLLIDEASQNIIIKTMLLAGDINKALADNAQSERYYLESVTVADKYGDIKSLALAYKNLGDLLRIGQRSQESIEYSKKALELYRQQDDLPRRAACLNNIGLALMNKGDYAPALDYFEQALTINEQINDLNEQAKLHSNIGIINDITGKIAEVLPRFTKALECARAIGNVSMETISLNNLGFFHLNSGNPQKALEYFMMAGELAQKAGHTEQQINIMANIAWAYNKIGNFIKSAETNQKTLNLARELNNDMFNAQASHLLARDCLAMGNYKLADQMLSQSQHFCANLANNELIIDILLTQIELNLELGEISGARRLLEKYHGVASPTNKQTLFSGLLNARLLSLQNAPETQNIYDELTANRKQSKSPEMTAMAVAESARFHLQCNQLDAALELLNEPVPSDIQNILFEFDRSLVSAELAFKLNKFDEALSQLKTIKEKSEKSGCLPVLFKAIVLEAEIYSRCGKVSALTKTAAKADRLYQALIAALPDWAEATQFEQLPFSRRLKLLITQKPQAALAR